MNGGRVVTVTSVTTGLDARESSLRPYPGQMPPHDPSRRRAHHHLRRPRHRPAGAQGALRRRLRVAVADPGRDHPGAARRAATCSARRRPAPARPRRSRCRSSARSTSSRRRRRPWCWPRPASSRSRWPRPSSATPRTSPASTCCRSTAARATASSCPRCAAACTSSSAPRAGSSTTWRRARSTCRELRFLVLDEADEMLRMGFIDDVETDPRRHPRRQAGRAVLRDDAAADPPHRADLPQRLRSRSRSRPRRRPRRTSRQRYLIVSGLHKLDALTRILEAETFDGMIVFARTKQVTEELAEKLQARGFSAAAINGDIEQEQRERTIDQLKDGQARHPGRHRRRRARPRRRAHQPRGELRHPLRHRELRAPHRPHRPRGPQRRGDLVRHPARAAPAQGDRARHPPADQADAAAERRGRQRDARRQVPRAHHRGARLGPGRRSTAT